MDSPIDKRAFDPSVCFMFFGTWYKTIIEVEETQSIEAAYTLFKAIADYSIYEIEPHFTSIPFLRVLWPMIENNIDSSISNRKRHFDRDMLDEKKSRILDALTDHPSATLREIAAMTETNKSLVDRVKKKYAAEIAAAAAKNSGSTSGIDPDADISFNNNFINNNTSDHCPSSCICTSQDRDGTMGQISPPPMDIRKFTVAGSNKSGENIAYTAEGIAEIMDDIIAGRQKFDAEDDSDDLPF